MLTGPTPCWGLPRPTPRTRPPSRRETCVTQNWGSTLGSRGPSNQVGLPLWPGGAESRRRKLRCDLLRGAVPGGGHGHGRQPGEGSTPWGGFPS